MRLDRADPGFTLVEALAAFTILAVSMVVLSGGLATTFHRESGSRVREDLLRIAENEMNGAGILGPLEAGVTRGVSPDGYEWVVTIEPYEAGSPTVSVPEGFWVDVVAGRSSGGPQIKLRTLKRRKGKAG